MWVKAHEAVVVLEEEYSVVTLHDLGVHVVLVSHVQVQLKPVERHGYVSISRPENGALIHGPFPVAFIPQNTIIEVPELQIQDDLDLVVREHFQSIVLISQTSLYTFYVCVLEIKVVVILIVIAVEDTDPRVKYVDHVVCRIIM